MSQQLMKLVHSVPLKTYEKDVLRQLVFHAHNDGSNCFPAVTTLAREVGCSARTVQRVLKKLETAGYITIELQAHTNSNQQQTNSYHINVEKLGGCQSVTGSGDGVSPGGVTCSREGGDRVSYNHRGPKSLPNADSDFSRPGFEIITEAEADRRFEEERKSRP